jgi:hypothetical protein
MPPASKTSSAKPPAEWMSSLGAGTRVFVLDDGVKAERHLPVVRYVDFCPGSGRGRGTHGTIMSRVIASRDPLHLGVAPQCDLYVGRVIGGRSQSAVADALEWAASCGAHVINMSFACGSISDKVRMRLGTLAAAGCLCFAAYNADLPYPHSLPEVISVSPIDRPGHADVSTTGLIPRLSSDGPGDPFRGSSVATAVMAGIAACAKGVDRTIDRHRFLDAIRAVHFN